MSAEAPAPGRPALVVPAEPTARTLPDTAFGRVIHAAAATVERVQGKVQPASVGLRLREHVFVMRSGDQGSSDLPEGTAVDLVKSEGRFLRVRHDQTIVTLPRSAVILGVVQTN